MEFTSYEQALDFIKTPNGKIKVVAFVIKDCPTCDDFVPHVFEPAITERQDHFEMVKVDLATANMPFPPTGTPTFYFYIPNTTEQMPLFRVSGTVPSVLKNDLDSMIRVKDEGVSINEAFQKPKEITSWVNRLLW